MITIMRNFFFSIFAVILLLPQFAGAANENTFSVELEKIDESAGDWTYNHHTSIDVDFLPFTWEVWVYLDHCPEDDGSAKYTIIGGASSELGHVAPQLFVSVVDCAPVMDFGGGYTLQPGTSLSTSSWHHIAMVAESTTTARMYVDGAQVANETTLAIDFATTNPTPWGLSVGAQDQNEVIDDFFEGKIDDVRFWNVARTVGDITSTMSCQLNGSENNLLGNWQYNNTYADATTLGNTMTAIATPIFATSVPYTDTCYPPAPPLPPISSPLLAAFTNRQFTAIRNIVMALLFLGIVLSLYRIGERVLLFLRTRL